MEPSLLALSVHAASTAGLSLLLSGVDHQAADQQVDGGHDGEHGQGEDHHQPAGVLAGLILALEEIHGHGAPRWGWGPDRTRNRAAAVRSR